MNNEILEKNLRELKEKYPDIFNKISSRMDELSSPGRGVSIRVDPDGKPNAIIRLPDGKREYLHDKNDPIAEAETFVKSINFKGEVICVLGLGLGYYLFSIHRYKPYKKPVLVIEPDLSIFFQLIKYFDISDYIKSKDYAFIIDSSPYDSIYGGASMLYNLSTIAGYQIITITEFQVIQHPVMFKLYPDFFKTVVQFMNNLVLASRRNLATLSEFAPIWENNIITNIPYMLKSPGVIPLKDIIKNNPVVIIAAGPSLDKSISLLKKIRDKAIFFCVDTALRTVTNNGIEPDIVLTVDAQKENTRYYDDIALDNLYLVSDGLSDPDLVNRFNGRWFVMHYGHPLMLWMEKLTGQEKGFLKVSGSVTTLGLSLAIESGADKIIFVGLDLSFTAGQYHSKESHHSMSSIELLSKFETLEERYRRIMSLQLKKIPLKIQGSERYTNEVMLAWKEWIEKNIKSAPAGIKFYNATSEGLNIVGADKISITELDDSLKKLEFNPRERISDILKTPLEDKSDRIFEVLRKTKFECEKLSEKISDGLMASGRLKDGQQYNKALSKCKQTVEYIKNTEYFHKICTWSLEPIFHEITVSGAVKDTKKQKEWFDKLFKAVQSHAKRISNCIEKILSRRT